MVHLEPHNGELLLRIYDLRREDKLRKARAWVMSYFEAGQPQEFGERYPPGSEGNVHYRQVVSYWDMVAAIVNHGMLNEELYFETTTESLMVWLRVKNVALEIRESRKNPLYLLNLELLAEKHEKWLTARAPGALEETRKLLASMHVPAKA